MAVITVLLLHLAPAFVPQNAINITVYHMCVLYSHSTCCTAHNNIQTLCPHCPATRMRTVLYQSIWTLAVSWCWVHLQLHQSAQMSKETVHDVHLMLLCCRVIVLCVVVCMRVVVLHLVNHSLALTQQTPRVISFSICTMSLCILRNGLTALITQVPNNYVVAFVTFCPLLCPITRPPPMPHTRCHLRPLLSRRTAVVIVVVVLFLD